MSPKFGVSMFSQTTVETQKEGNKWWQRTYSTKPTPLTSPCKHASLWQVWWYYKVGNKLWYRILWRLHDDCPCFPWHFLTACSYCHRNTWPDYFLLPCLTSLPILAGFQLWTAKGLLYLLSLERRYVTTALLPKLGPLTNIIKQNMCLLSSLINTFSQRNPH